MIFTPTEFALIHFDGLVTTTYLDGATLQKNLHGFPAEHPPVCDGVPTMGVFFSDRGGFIAANDVVC